MSQLAQQSFERPSQFLYLEEITHRVVNEYTQAISLINLAAAKSPSCEARDVLFNAADRLRAYAEAHRALQAPTGQELVDLSEYLAQLCASLTRASLSERGIQLTLVQAEASLSAERCWGVGLIISELITNAARHGLRHSAGVILVQMHTSSGEVRCVVSNSGRTSPNPEKGRGRRIVEALARELGGTVAWEFAKNGTQVELAFPIEETGQLDAYAGQDWHFDAWRLRSAQW